MKIYVGLSIIGIATFLSFLIANIPTGSDPGLGGFILLLWPPIVGVASAIVFLAICAITKNKTSRLLSSVLMATYLIYVGLGLYVDKGWPLVY